MKLATNYFGNIDFLKSLAIFFVCLYHFEPSIFQSGYIGVDIFLVVSGYLSAMSLSKYTPWSFVKGRLRRIYPSLSAMLVVSLFFMMIFGFYHEIINFSKYMISSSLLLTNFHLFLDKGYFSESTASNLLFHLWSISLEFQLWLLIAVLYALKFRVIARVLAVISFIVSVCFLSSSQVDIFYLNPMLRFWEAWLGFEMYLMSNKGQTKFQLKFPLHYFLFTAIFFLILIDLKDYYILWFFTPVTCALFLLCDFSLGKWMAYLIRFISARTYAYYLWHVPVIVSMSYYFPFTGWLKLLSVLAITLILSELSYRLIENATRTHKNRLPPSI